MKRIKLTNIENLFLDERLMKYVSILSAVSGLISLVIIGNSGELDPLFLFDKTIKIIMTLLTLRAFSRFHWDAMKGMMGGLLFALLYQESFLVLGKLWGETADFDNFLVMGVQGSLYLSAQSMSFLMTAIIIINHFVINYSLRGNYRNVIFNQISILFKVFLYLLLLAVNMFLNIPLISQIDCGFEYLSDLCIVIMVICIETQLDSFKEIRSELLQSKNDRQEQADSRVQSDRQEQAGTQKQ